MEQRDIIVFWIIETIIIISVLAVSYYIFKEYSNLPENYTPPLHNGKIWILRIYHVLPEFCLGGIIMGTIINISALFTTKLKFFGKLSWCDKIFIRLCVAVLTPIIPYMIIGWIYMRF